MMIYFSISLGIAIYYITLGLLLKDQQKVKRIPHTFPKYCISHKIQQFSKSSANLSILSSIHPLLFKHLWLFKGGSYSLSRSVPGHWSCLQWLGHLKDLYGCGDHIICLNVNKYIYIYVCAVYIYVLYIYIYKMCCIYMCVKKMCCIYIYVRYIHIYLCAVYIYIMCCIYLYIICCIYI